MRLAVGVLGGATASFDEPTLGKLTRLGRAVAECDSALITGMYPSIPYAVVQGARAAGGMVIGISPARSAADHMYMSGAPIGDFDVVIYTDADSMGCEADIIRSSDVVVIAAGRLGAAVDLEAPYKEGRPIGVLTQTRGIADAVEVLVRICADRPFAAVLCDDDPVRLVDRLIECYRTVHDEPDTRVRRPADPVTADGNVGD